MTNYGGAEADWIVCTTQRALAGDLNVPTSAYSRVAPVLIIDIEHNVALLSDESRVAGEGLL